MTNRSHCPRALPSPLLCALMAWIALPVQAAGELRIQPLPNPAAAGSAEPHLAVSSAGEAVMSWLEPDVAGTALRFAVLRGSGFGPASTVTAGNDLFVNWADFPSVEPIDAGLWAAHWLVQQPGSVYAYDVAIAVSTDAGRTWSAAVTPHSDGTATEHGFVSLFPSGQGVGAVWLDGRQMAADGPQDLPDGHGEHAGAAGMTLRSARISREGAVVEESLVDELVCDCCQTDVAIGSQGPLVVYRNRTGDEVRDIHVAQAVGSTWTPDRNVFADGWTISGCPVNGPAIAAEGDRVAVAWFTLAGDLARVRFARSNDGGKTFDPALDIDSGAPLGRVDVALLEGDGAAVSWLRETDDLAGELVFRRVADDGSLGAVHRISALGSGRAAGFPQMAAIRGGLVFAWTEGGTGQTLVKTARADFSP